MRRRVGPESNATCRLPAESDAAAAEDLKRSLTVYRMAFARRARRTRGVPAPELGNDEKGRPPPRTFR